MKWRGMLLAVIAVPACLTAELLPIRAYSIAQGLAADQVGCIVPDSRGFLWFCTPEGLSRFDGNRMVNFGVGEGLPHRMVEDLLETRSGDYLVATPHGLCRLRPGAHPLTPYLPGNTPRENHVTVLRETRTGRIWCGTANGLFEVLGGFKFRSQPLPIRSEWDRISVTDILEDPSGKLWVSTTSGIDVIETGGTAQHLGRAEGLLNEWVSVSADLKQPRFRRF